MSAKEQVDFAIDNHRGLSSIQMVLVPAEIWAEFCKQIGQSPDGNGEVIYRDLPAQIAAAKTMVTLIVG